MSESKPLPPHGAPDHECRLPYRPPPETKPAVPAMTPDEARATLCRSVAAQLEESVRRAEADLDARQAAPGFEPTAETNNIALVTLATLELRDSLLLSAKQFDKSSRPRILRPERSVRIVR
jgi:hypothetical protein